MREQRREEERAWETDFFARLADNGKQLLEEQRRAVEAQVRGNQRAAELSRGDEREDGAAEEEEDDMLTSLFKRPSVGSRRQHRRFQVSLRKPLGLFLAQSKDGLVISKVRRRFSCGSAALVPHGACG